MFLLSPPTKRVTNDVANDEVMRRVSLHLKPVSNLTADDTFDDITDENWDASSSNLLAPPPHQGRPWSSFWSYMQWFWNIVGPSGFWTPPPQPEEENLTPPEKCDPCSCGLVNKRTRIVGGVETKVNQYPWMVMLSYDKRFYCGGTLISDRYVLTAAHCLYGFDYRRVRVRLLEHDRHTASETQTLERRVARVRLHRRYDEDNFNNDIALIKLSQPVDLTGTELLRTVCLPEKGRSFSGMEGIVTGWGVTEALGSPAGRLREVMVPIMSNTDCRKTAYGQRRITDNMLCAGYPEGKKDSCQGDSGGPLHIQNDTHHHIAGVVSWGEGCAQPNYPGVYTRVNRYLTWITKNTIDSCFCS